MSPLSFFARHPRADLSAFIDGQLSPERRVAVETHLARCDSCQAEVEGLLETRAALSALPQAPAPRSFALTPNQLAQPARPTPKRTETAPAFLGMRIASAGLAVALALVFVADLGDGGSSNGGGDDAALSIPQDSEFMTTSGDDDAAPEAAGGGDIAVSPGSEPTGEKTEEASFAARPANTTPPDAPEDGQRGDETDVATGGAGGVGSGAGVGGSAPTPTAVDGGPVVGDTDLATAVPSEIAAVVPTATDDTSIQYNNMSTSEERTSEELAIDNATGDNDDGLSALQIAEIVLAVTLAVAVTGGFLVPLALRKTR